MNTIPCPHCGQPVAPASLMAKLRVKTIPKHRRIEIAQKAGKASKKARLAKQKATK